RDETEFDQHVILTNDKNNQESSDSDIAEKPVSPEAMCENAPELNQGIQSKNDFDSPQSIASVNETQTNVEKQTVESENQNTLNQDQSDDKSENNYIDPKSIDCSLKCVLFWSRMFVHGNLSKIRTE